MSSFDELEQDFLDAVDESGVAETGKLVPVATVDPDERRKRREVMERRSGQELQKKWAQEDRRSIEEAEALAAPAPIVNDQCLVCQSEHRLWIERQLVKGHAYKRIADQIPDGSVSRKSISNHYKLHMQIDQQAVRAILEEEATAIGQNLEEGVRGALTLRGMMDVMIRKAFQDAMDGVTTIEPRDMVQMAKTLNELNANVGQAAYEEAKLAIQIFKEGMVNVLLKGDVVEREVGVELLEALEAEVNRLRDDQAADAVMDRTLALPSGS